MILRQERIHRRRFAVADATRHRVEVLDEFELYVILGGHECWACGPVGLLHVPARAREEETCARLKQAVR